MTEFSPAIYGRLNAAVEAIHESGLEGMSNKTSYAMTCIRDHKMYFAPNSPKFNIPSVSGFDLSSLPNQRSVPNHAGVLIFNPEMVLTADSARLQGDMVRTYAVAYQFPFNGFQRRLRDVYTDALETQGRWLEGKRIDPILYDPRGADREDLVRFFIREERYYSDVGFEDFQKAIEIQRNTGSKFRSVLLRLNTNMGFFVAARQIQLPKIHQELMGEVGDDYKLKWNFDQRAKRVADSLLRDTLNP